MNFQFYPDTNWYLYKDGADNLGIFNDSAPLKISLGSAANPGIALNDTLYISPTATNTLDSGYGTNADSGAGTDIWINYHGYLDGISRFRDFRVGDGKGNQLLLVQGSTGNASFAGQVTTTQLNAGAAVVTGTVQAAQFRSDAQYTSTATPQVDFSNQGTTLTLASGATSNLPVGAGILLICDTNTSGQTAVYMLGGGSVAVLSSGTAFVVSAAPAAGTTGITWTGTAYQIKNGGLGSRTYQYAFFKIRASN